MINTKMVNADLDYAMKLLDWLEENCNLRSPLKDQVLTLKQKSRFLRTYLIYSGISEANPFASSSVISSVEAAFKTAKDELYPACRSPLDLDKVDSVVSYMLENVKLCEPEIRKAYAILWEQPWWEANYPLIPASSMDFIDSIVENLEELLGSESLASMMKKTVAILKEKLIFLRNFIDIIAKRPIIHKEMGAFLSHVHISATRAACFSYLCWDSQLDEVMARGMVDKLSDLLQKIKRSTSDLIDMFIGLLKASISAGSETTKKDEITSFISFLLENTVECLKDQIDSIDEELLSLIAFLMDLPDECTGDLEKISADIKAAAEEAALFQVIKVQGSEMTEDIASELNLSVFRLLEKIKLIKAEVILGERLNFPGFGLMVHIKDEVETLQEGVRFLRALLMNPPKADGELIMAKSEATANEAASLIFNIHYHVRKENTAFESKMNHLLSELVEKIAVLKAEIKDTCPQVPHPNRYHLQQYKDVEFIRNIFLDTIKMLNPEASSLALVKRQTEMLLREFKFLESFLMKNEELCFYNEHQELKDIMVCIAEISRGTKHNIDLIMDGDDPVWYFMLSAPVVMEDIKLIKAKVMEIYDEKKYDIGAHAVAPARPLTIEDVAVGIEDEINLVISELLTGTKETSIFSIHGNISGIGKTTLAQRVYNHEFVVTYFPIRAWCCVSQKYHIRESLLEILRDITVVTNSMYEMSDDELAGELRKHLIQKRYLIVLDDIRDREALKDLRRKFQDNNDGSRILLTTRMPRVTDEPHSFGLRIRLLTDEQCWWLFQEKIFGGETLHPSFEEVGIQIINQCMGVPLAVLLIAGLLSNTERKLSCWKQVAESLRLEIKEPPQGSLLGVQRFVYKTLPDHLKPCLLCFREFSEDQEIHARKLFELWIEKGLIQETDSKTMENVAEERLLNLASRNLVTVSRRRYDGSVRACRIHDWVGEFCMRM